MRTLARLLAAALSLAALASPGVASAARHRGHHAAGPSYPMKADEFRALMEKRIDGVRATIDRKLDRRGVSADRKKAIHKVFDEASKDLRAEIAHAAADGTVTQGEADKVKALVVGLRGKVRERLRAEKDPLARAKLDKADATKKEKARAKEKAAHEGAAPAHAPDAHDHAASMGKPPARPAKTADAGTHTAAHKAGGVTKAKSKGPGATKPARSAPGKKRKRAEADPGAEL